MTVLLLLHIMNRMVRALILRMVTISISVVGSVLLSLTIISIIVLYQHS